MWRSGRTATIVIVAGLGASAVLLGLAPLLMPAGYSVLSHTTSESAAQGVGGAWLARAGFGVFGLSVLVLTAMRRRAWGPAAILHGLFGGFMIAAGVFSSRPWAPGASYDRTEDLLHSVAATAVGFAFALGVAATFLRAGPVGRRLRWPLDAVALLASVLIPLAMTALPEADGAMQRVMFAVAYVWYATEAVRVAEPRGSRNPQATPPAPT